MEKLQIKMCEMRAKIESQFHSRKVWPAVKPFRVSPNFPAMVKCAPVEDEIFLFWLFYFRWQWARSEECWIIRIQFYSLSLCVAVA